MAGYGLLLASRYTSEVQMKSAVHFLVHWKQLRDNTYTAENRFASSYVHHKNPFDVTEKSLTNDHCPNGFKSII